MSRDASPVRCQKFRWKGLVGLLQNSPIRWIDSNKEYLKELGVLSDDFIAELFENYGHVCRRLNSSSLFQYEDRNNIFPYNFIDDHPHRLYHCIENCDFYLGPDAIKEFAKRRCRKVLCLIVEQLSLDIDVFTHYRNWCGMAYVWGIRERVEQVSIVSQTLHSNPQRTKEIQNVVRTYYQKPIRDFCLTYFSLTFECNAIVLEAYSVCYPKELKDCFQ